MTENLIEFAEELIRNLPDEKYWGLLSTKDTGEDFSYMIAHHNFSLDVPMITVSMKFEQGKPGAGEGQREMSEAIYHSSRVISELLNRVHLAEDRIKYLEQRLLDAKVRF